ncbi:MAG: hypothetical protein JWN37_3 [Candidatus Nomurabacteria bacterium]|nr:hypothetical protein [Candidatus Nomurabacteria bacterium]
MENRIYKWPAREGVVRMVISNYKHATDRSNDSKEDKPKGCYELTNSEDIDTFFKLLNQIPTEGQMFVSFTSEVPLIAIDIFYEDGKKGEVEFYEERVKTPATSFLAEDNSEEIEKPLLDFMKSHF